MKNSPSRLAGFHRYDVPTRRSVLGDRLGLHPDEVDALCGVDGLDVETANHMVENGIGVFALPLGLGLNLVVNGHEYVVPMAVEEASVIAAVSSAAKLVKQGGGFTATATEPVMIGQIQVARYGDPEQARAVILKHADELVALANAVHPQLVARGGGAQSLEVRVLPAPEGPSGEPLLVVHLHIDTREAMGANLVNTMAEAVAPHVEKLTGGRVYLRILSNLADRRLASARCAIPIEALEDFGFSGLEVAEGISQASRFAQADPYRAATHNKGIMNGIDAAAIAAGQDWRAIEAGAHAFAARHGRYQSLSVWRLEGQALVGEIELPLALGTVGGALKVHPGVKAALKTLGHPSARELAMVLAAVGLAQNLAAVRALGSVGIQKGHMALHARSIALSAGAPHDWVEDIAREMVKAGEVKPEKAAQLLTLRRERAGHAPHSKVGG